MYAFGLLYVGWLGYFLIKNDYNLKGFSFEIKYLWKIIDLMYFTL